ncbi:sulfatase-like hydrolase/transferase [Lentisphaera profundi]|uniref:Sulfatase-like hydrolase/transferase n=1 Tax=Lentisphaera profundi TaxID=1658616 RepID=A0ABY7VX60_9BACT|nr:sulfatase-like hydrolase/transferase [Lentisphaera profundi]WDE97314.1 sulfatase-like hydrolase/transferase [Lentisphaera profundi]
MDQNTELKEADFLKLFLKHENALRVFARSILPSWRNVDDVLQEASIVMWEKLDQLDGEEGFFPWGKTIIRFKCMNLMQKKTNIILIYADDLGKGMLSHYGQKHLTTPNIDSIAQQGMEFKRYYGSAYCAPARYTLLTGMHDGHKGTGQHPELLKNSLPFLINRKTKKEANRTSCHSKILIANE